MTTKRILSLVTAGILTVASLSAADYECCDPCESPCQSKCGYLDGLSVGADFLYWTVCSPSLDYAILYNSNPAITPITNSSGDVQYLEHCFQPGFRVWADFDDLLCGWDLAASYTYLKTTEDRSFAREPTQFVSPIYQLPGFYNIALNLPTTVAAESAVRYQTFDVLVGFDYNCFGDCHTLGTFFGLEGLKFDQHNVLVISTPVEPAAYTIDWNSELKGLGFKVGTAYEWNCCYGLNWFAKGSFSLLVGDNNTHNRQTNGTVEPDAVRNINESSCICVPGFHLAAGLDYSACLCGWNFGARVGYEFFDWWNIPQQKKYQVPANFQYSTTGTGGNLVLHGLFAGAYVTF